MLAELGRPNVTIGLIRGNGGLSPCERNLELLQVELLKAAEYAAKKNIRLNLEPINRYECKLLNSAADTYDFLSTIGNPENVGILFDTFHANIEDVGVVSALADTVDRVVHVHLADSNRTAAGRRPYRFPGRLRVPEGKRLRRLHQP